MLRLRPTRLLALGGARAASRSSTGSRSHTYLRTKQQLQTRQAEVRALRDEKAQLEKRIAQAGTGGAARARGPAARAGEAGRAAVHRQGHPHLAPAAPKLDLRYVHRRPRGRRAAARPARRGRFARVAVRCPFGRPAVTEQAPFDEDGRPFPTQFYVTCPYLVAAISRLEAAGGVERWIARGRDDPELAQSLAAAQAEQRALRPELDAGIGGSTRSGSLKCLHAHAAFALARPGLRARRPHPRRAARALARRLAVLPDRWTSSSRASSGRTATAGSRRRAATAPRYRQLTGRSTWSSTALRRRVGQIFTLAELADAYDGADDWARDAARRRRPRRRRRRSSRGRSPTPPSTSTRAARRTTAREARLLARGRPSCVVFVVGRRGRRGAARQPGAGRDADARADAEAAAARARGARNRDGDGPKPMNLRFR